MIISLVSNEGQKCRDIIVGWTIDCKMNLSCQLIVEPWAGTKQRDLQPVEIEHAHLSVSNQSYLSASPHTLVKQLLQIES
jgi:hypothetical protein